MENINTLLSFNKQLHDLVESKLQLDINDGNNKDFFVAFVMAKAFKTYEALGVLCRAGYGEDAFMLARTLFELMITTAYILQDETEGRLLRYMSYDWVTRKKMYEYVVTKEELLIHLNKEIESGNRDNTIAEVEEEYKKAMEKYHYNNNGWSDKNIKEMSEAVGRADAYSTVYKLQCTVSHTNARSMNEYIKITEEGTILNIGPNWDLVQNALVIAFDFFFHIAKQADSQFSWGIENTLEELAKNWSEEVGKMKS
jgi:hypothetical protein